MRSIQELMGISLLVGIIMAALFYGFATYPPNFQQFGPISMQTATAVLIIGTIDTFILVWVAENHFKGGKIHIIIATFIGAGVFTFVAIILGIAGIITASWNFVGGIFVTALVLNGLIFAFLPTKTTGNVVIKG